jgi:hypothetical protein
MNRVFLDFGTIICKENDSSVFLLSDNYANGFMYVDKEYTPPESDLEFLSDVFRSSHEDDLFRQIFEFLKSEGQGITIRGTEYSWEQIKPILDSQ